MRPVHRGPRSASGAAAVSCVTINNTNNKKGTDKKIRRIVRSVAHHRASKAQWGFRGAPMLIRRGKYKEGHLRDGGVRFVKVGGIMEAEGSWREFAT